MIYRKMVQSGAITMKTEEDDGEGKSLFSSTTSPVEQTRCRVFLVSIDLEVFKKF